MGSRGTNPLTGGRAKTVSLVRKGHRAISLPCTMVIDGATMMAPAPRGSRRPPAGALTVVHTGPACTTSVVHAAGHPKGSVLGPRQSERRCWRGNIVGDLVVAAGRPAACTRTGGP